MKSTHSGGAVAQGVRDTQWTEGVGAAPSSTGSQSDRGGADADISTRDTQSRTGIGAAAVHTTTETHDETRDRGGAEGHSTREQPAFKSQGAAADARGNLDDQFRTRGIRGGATRPDILRAAQDLLGPGGAVADCQVEIMPLLATISVLVAARRSILRSEIRAGQASKAFCRLVSGGDKDEGDKLLAKIKAGDGTVPGLVVDVVNDHLAAAKLYRLARKARERQIAKLVEQLPVWQSWAAGVRGFGAVGFGMIVAETYANGSGHFTVSQHWQRLGIGAIDFETASRRRKTAMYVIGSSLVKQGAEYRDFYLAAKDQIAAAHPDLTKLHVHNRAQRLMVKRLVADLWERWTEWRFGAAEKEIAA